MNPSSTATSRLSVPMSKRTVFTTITPLPPHITRAAIVDFLHDYEAMIDINPLVTDRHRIHPPQNADPDEVNCVWYQLTDAVVMPWSASSPTSSSTDNMAAKQKSGNVSYTCAFHPLPDGLQTHCRAPLGVDIRDRWTVGGTLPGEPRQPIELGLDALGAPASGLYLREDVDLHCNRLMSGFVKKTLKKSHEAVVLKLNSDLSSAHSAMGYSPASQQSASSKSGSIDGVVSPTKPRPTSTSPTTLAQRPAPYRVYPSQQQSQQRRRPDPQSQYEPFQSMPEWLQVKQPQQQQQPQPQPQPAQPQRRPHSQQYPPAYSPSQAHQQYQLHRQQQQHHQPYQRHHHAHSYSHNAQASVPPQPQYTSVPASLAIGPPPPYQQSPQQPPQQAPQQAPQQVQQQTQQHKQQQNQQLQRTLHPHFPQPERVENRVPVDLSSLSVSPSMSFTSASTSWTASTASTAVSPPPCPSSASSTNSPVPSPPAMPYDRINMNASPLTRLQLQLPRVTTVFPPPATTAAEMGSTWNSNKTVGNDSFAAKEQRHSLYQQLLPPLVFSAREVVASEPRRKSTGSDAASASASGAIYGIDGLPFHDVTLCPQPLRIGGNRSASASQSQQPNTALPQSLAVAQPKEKAAEQPPLVQAYRPFKPAQLVQQVSRPIEFTAPIEPIEPIELVEPVEPVSATAAEPIEYPEMNPYVYNEDDYEDIYVDTPILASDAHAHHNGPYSPTVFAELDNGTSSSSNGEASASASIDPVVSPKVPEWQQWRKYLQDDTD